MCQSLFFNNFFFLPKIQTKTSMSADILKKACSFIKKETLAQVFFCQICEISRNNFFCRTPLVAAPASCLYRVHKICLYRVASPQDFKGALSDLRQF